MSEEKEHNWLARKAIAILSERSRRVAAVLDPWVKGKTLDVGCFNGDVVTRLSNTTDVFGIEVEIPEETLIPVKEFDGVNIPHKDKEFDSVLCTCVLHHAEKPNELLQEMRRVGKKVYVLEDSVDTMFGRASVVGLHKLMEFAGMPFEKTGFHTHQEWLQIFDKNGFNVTHHEHVPGIIDFPCLSHEFYILEDKDAMIEAVSEE